MSTQNLGHTSIKVVLIAVWLGMLITPAESQRNYTNYCSLPSDENIEFRFLLTPWMRRGICIRTGDNGVSVTCAARLTGAVASLAPLREAEYAGAASVLSLLPTIGALFGPPTSEIWKLKSIVPFAGALAMGVSFGGALMPVHAEDYENAIAKDETVIGRSNPRNHAPKTQKNAADMDEMLQELSDKIRQRVGRRESVRLPKRTLLSGLVVIFVLFAMAQSAMAVVEQGAVINFICSWRYWMHLWYFLATFAAWSEDRAYRPFKKTYKLYVSSLPYDVEVLDGQSITDHFSNSTSSENALNQLKTLKPASLQFWGSRLRTNAGNSVMVMVSIVGPQKWASFWQRLSRCFSVAVFVTGTAFFASVTLLSLIMAVVVLTLTLAAGIFGRAIASGIVSHVEEVEPVIPISFKTKDEAYRAIAEILSLKSDDGSPFQVEIEGQILIDGRRVAHRSRLPVAMFGVLADPYDIAGPHRNSNVVAHNLAGASTPLNTLSPPLTNASGDGRASTPFLSRGGAAHSLPLHRSDVFGALNLMSHESTRSVPSSENTDVSFQIARRPVPNSDPEQ